MITRRPRPLPGIRFETVAPTLPEVLPRMDIPLFVGFAACGPRDLPVAVESPAQFETVFGEDAPLVWDEVRGEQIYAYLAPAVRAFFRGGGQRCWVVRVAGASAQYNHYPILGLVRATFDANGKPDISQAVARARSEGSWSNALLVSSALRSRSIRAQLTHIESGRVEIAVQQTPELKAKAGDLLRLTMRDQGVVLMCVVGAVTPIPPPDSPPTIPAVYNASVSSQAVLWLQLKAPLSREHETSGGWAELSDANGHHLNCPATFIPTTDGKLRLNLGLPSTQTINDGTLIRVEFGAEIGWMMVEETRIVEVETSPLSPLGHEFQLQAEGRGYWLWEPSFDSPLDTYAVSGEVLSFDLLTLDQPTDRQQMTELGFAPAHARYWNALPVDLDAYDEGKRDRLTAENPYATLWRDSFNPRFPLAGGVDDISKALYFPLFVPILPEGYLGALEDGIKRLERDGLETFDAGVFLDSAFDGVGVRTLMERAKALRYETAIPQRLRGVYAALELDEVTLVAVPDAIHPGWHQPPPRVAAAPPKPDPLPIPDRGQFLTCGLDPLTTPHLSINAGLMAASLDPCITADPATQGNFSLTWTSLVISDPETPIYFLEESTDPDPKFGVLLYTGTKTTLEIYGRPAGTYYYRVRTELGRRQSAWSESVCITIQAPRGWLLNRAYDQAMQLGLLEVQKRLLEICAARGDVLAVLALPATFRESDAIHHVNALKSLFIPGLETDVPNIDSLLTTGYGSSTTLSYGTLYHPWLFSLEAAQANVRLSPPDGAACGVLARRARTRGAWIAPANESLEGVIALTPPIAESRWLDLQEAHINIIRQEPSGFLMLHDDTLAGDTDETLDLRPINVRRLLMLMRRLVLKVGPTYVFELNNDSFRRSVQRGFEALMEYLFVRGAFAGKTPETSFQVRTDVATTQMMEQGRFIVELRVAPSLPMRFLTVRLVQTGDRSNVTEGAIR